VASSSIWQRVEAHARDEPALFAAEKVARAADLHVERGDVKARAELRVALQRFDPRARLVRELARRREEQIAIRPLARAPDSTAKLVELREPEEVGAVDDHRVGSRDVEPALDDGRRREHVELAVHEIEHRLLEGRVLELSVSYGDARLRHDFAKPRGALVQALDPVEDVKDLSAAAIAEHGVHATPVDLQATNGSSAVDGRRRDELALGPPTAAAACAGWRRRRRKDVVRSKLLQALLVVRRALLFVVTGPRFFKWTSFDGTGASR
jgi:hypothetical protein